MSTSKIEAQVRVTNNPGNKALRREGFVPAVIYGHKDTPMTIKINHNEIRNLLMHHGTKAKLDISLDGKDYPVFIKDLQKDPVIGNILSLDFQILYQDEATRMEIPISFHNASSVIEYIFHEDLTNIEVEALPKYLPERIDLDVEGITPEKPIRVSDLKINDDKNVKVLTDKDAFVASAHFKKELIEETETETEEPELIGSTEEE